MSSFAADDLPYWQVNVEPGLRTEECPEYLLHIYESDKEILGQKDSDFQLMTWDRVKQIVAANRLELFKRVPSNLRKYLEYTWDLKQKYGSVLRFIVDERLQWKDLTPRSSRPFADQNDYTVLLNDWPYGLAPGIVHMVVWVKFPLEEDPDTTDITEGTRSFIDAYVAETFQPHVPSDDILWFRNTSALKSVHAVEHFHVMLNEPNLAFVNAITHGDVAMMDKIQARE